MKPVKKNTSIPTAKRSKSEEELLNELKTVANNLSYLLPKSERPIPGRYDVTNLGDSSQGHLGAPIPNSECYYRACEQLAISIANLNTSVDLLIGRLDGALVPPVPERASVSDVATQEVPHIPIIYPISEADRMIRGLQTRVDDVLTRLVL
jgi:hypothetical protein